MPNINAKNGVLDIMVARIIHSILAFFRLSPTLPKPTEPLTTADLFALAKLSVVEISVAEISRRGSGFFFDKQGWVVTNAHLVNGNDRAMVTLHDGSHLQGKVIGRNRFDDLAVISIDGRTSFSTLKMADSDQVNVGEDVLALGFPGGIRGEVTVTKGIVSAAAEDVFQTDAAINPGNSGGPLINSHGHVVGINKGRLDDPKQGRNIENIGFAIPSNLVSRWMPALKAGFVSDEAPFGVGARETVDYFFDLASGTKLVYEFHAYENRGRDIDINFRIVGPSDNPLVNETQVKLGKGEIKAASSGKFTFAFDNTDSFFTSKKVVLEYTIVPPGCPVPRR